MTPGSAIVQRAVAVRRFGKQAWAPQHREAVEVTVRLLEVSDLRVGEHELVPVRGVVEPREVTEWHALPDLLACDEPLTRRIAMTATDATEVIQYPIVRYDDLTIDPVYLELQRERGTVRAQLPYGEPCWVTTRYDDVKLVYGDRRFVKELGPVATTPG